ncbi:MAG: DUF1697 domain-containing protein [Rhodobacteraceae bacterium]|nr:DUF1697 domain-containing protein [Paracoccaceae bacterium]
MRQVVLLRAVNVGGTGKLAMADLKELCREAGCSDVRTYIASGNVVLTTDLDEKDLRAALEPRLAAHMGAPLPVFVRSAAEMQAILAANPFHAAEPKHTYAIFLHTSPPADALAQVRGATNERMAVGDREIFVQYPDGMGRSKLVIPAAKAGTARNMNTVTRLAEMAGAH